MQWRILKSFHVRSFHLKKKKESHPQLTARIMLNSAMITQVNTIHAVYCTKIELF